MTLSWGLHGTFQWLKKKKTTCNAEDTGDTAGSIPWRVRKIPWRRAWQPTPVFLLGESHGQRSLEGYRPQGCTELDTAEVTEHTHLRLTRRWVRNATPENLVCYSFMIKGKAGRGRDLCPSWGDMSHASFIRSSSRGVFLSLYGQARSMIMCADSKS